MSHRILGIDPGTVVTGYGIIEIRASKPIALDYGCIRPSPKTLLSKRYLQIYESISELLKRFQPTAVAVETQFMKNNPQSAMKLGMARGITILAAAQREISIFEYSPTKAKKAVVGTGKASKSQVQEMIKLLLNLPTVPQPEDAADALALALCHHNSQAGSLSPQPV